MIHSDDTLKIKKKQDLILTWKLQNPNMTLKEIAEKVQCSHSHARRTWSKFIKKQVTLRGSPKALPFQVQNFFFYGAVPSHWLQDLSLKESVNRNGQRVWMGQRVSAVFHKNGDCFIYPYYVGWEEELRNFLAAAWDKDRLDLFMVGLKRHGQMEHIAFNTQGVPTGYKVRIKGVGRFVTDKTPFPDGTTEFEFDPAMNQRLDRIENAMLVFAKGMEQHMALIGELRELVMELRGLKKNGD